MSASTDTDTIEKLLKILNLQADTALKEAQLRYQRANMQADTELKEAQLQYQRANAQADTELKLSQMRWEPWKVVATAMAAGGALVGGLVAAIVALLRATSHL